MELENLITKCRLCLDKNITKETERLAIGEIIREKFYNVTNFNLSYSIDLSGYLCHSCFGLVSRFDSLKNHFIRNQELLSRLLKNKEELREKNSYVKVQKIVEHHENSEKDNEINLIEKNYHVQLTCDDNEQHVKQKSDQNVIDENEHEIECVMIDEEELSCADDEMLEQFYCDQCTKSFKSQSNLNLHILRVHQKLKNNKCDKCSYESFTPYELLLHKINVVRLLIFY
jgi:hypothetical protein